MESPAEAAPGLQLLGPEMEIGSPLVHSQVTAVRIKPGMSPFVPAEFHCRYSVSLNSY